MISIHGLDEVKNLLIAHFISEQAFEFLIDDDFENFIIEREKDIKRGIIEFMSFEY